MLKEEDVVSLVCETKATPEIQSYKYELRLFLNTQSTLLNILQLKLDGTLAKII